MTPFETVGAVHFNCTAFDQRATMAKLVGCSGAILELGKLVTYVYYILVLNNYLLILTNE